MNSLEIKGRLWCQKVKCLLCRMLSIYQPLVHFEVEHYIINCWLLRPTLWIAAISYRAKDTCTWSNASDIFLTWQTHRWGVTTRWQHCRVVWEGHNIMIDNISDVSVGNDEICNIYSENEWQWRDSAVLGDSWWCILLCGKALVLQMGFR